MSSKTGCLPLALISYASFAGGQPWPNDLREVIVSSKISGGCSLLVQMAEFQQSTKMVGGDAFLERFLSMESARLGMSVDQYVKVCADASRIYQFYYDQSAPPGEEK